MPHDQTQGDLLSRIDERTETMAEAVDRIEHVLDGNGSPGLIRDVYLLKENASQRSWMARLILGGVILLALNAVWDRFVGTGSEQRTEHRK
jgi:hypothetical protein